MSRTTWRMSSLLGNYVTPVPAQQRLGPALVPGQRGRDPPVAQPGPRRTARLHRGVRRRPRLPHGPAADARSSTSRAARASRWRASGCRARTPRRSASSPRPATARAWTASWRSPPTRPACPAPRSQRLRLDGQLPLHHQDPHRGAAARTPRTPQLRARHGRFDPARCSPSAAWRSSTTSTPTTCPGETARDHGYWRDVGTLDAYYDAHMDLISDQPAFNLVQPALAHLHPPRAAAARQVLRGRHRGRVDRQPGLRDPRPGHPLGALAGCRRRRGRRRPGLGPARQRPDRPGRRGARRRARQERGRARRARPSASTRSGTPSCTRCRKGGVIALGKGQQVCGLTVPDISSAGALCRASFAGLPPLSVP